jgi:signal transduction histidine kinase
MVSMGALAWSFSQSIPVIINSTVSSLVTGLVVYGLVRLAQLVDELQAAGDRLARAAVVQERLRTARDLHDLLGHSLAAILLKCELARRLVDADPPRAQAELDDVVGIAERARADMHAVTGGEVEMSLRAELESARSVLTAADVEVGVEVGLEPVSDALPGSLDTVLSVVLREAVTNILRHSTARHCRIAVSRAPGCLRLTVDNDGVRAADRPPGAGLGNLITRLAVLDGTLAIHSGEDGWFRLRAELAVDQYPDRDQVRTGIHPVGTISP